MASEIPEDQFTSGMDRNALARLSGGRIFLFGRAKLLYQLVAKQMRDIYASRLPAPR